MTTPTKPRPPKIDPRIRERRVEVKRREGRRRLRILVVLLAVVLTVAGLGAATRSVLLDVDHVVISGAGHTPVPAVMRAAGLHRHRQMIDVHTPAVRRALRRLPWIDVVSVQRRWPATIRIDVRERKAVASLPAGGGGWAVADRTGRVLERAAAPAADLPQIAGGPLAGAAGTTVDPRVAGALRVAAAMPDALRTRAPVVVVAADGLELKLAPSGVVRLGSADQIEAKLDAVLTVLDHANTTGLSVLDVRVPGAPVLTRR